MHKIAAMLRVILRLHSVHCRQSSSQGWTLKANVHSRQRTFCLNT